MAGMGKIKALTYRRRMVLESLKTLDSPPSDDSQPKCVVVQHILSSMQCHSEVMLSMKCVYKRSKHAQNNVRKLGKDGRTAEPEYALCLSDNDKLAKVHTCSCSQRKGCGSRLV